MMPRHVPGEDDLIFGPRAVRTLGLMLRTLLVVLPALVAVSAPYLPTNLSLVLGGLVLAILALWLLHRAGRHEAVLVGLVCVLIVFGGVSMATYGSIRSVTSLALVGAIVVGGIFLGWRALALLVLASAVALGAVVWAERQGWLPVPDFRTGAVQWGTHVVVLGVIALNLWFARSLMLAAMRRSRESEERFRQLFEASPAATVIYTAAEGRIQACNPAYEALLGRRRADLVGRTGLEIGLWRDPAERERLRGLHAHGGNLRNMELALVAADGSVRNCLSNRSFLDIDGKRSVLAQVIDVTPQHAARAALRQSEERFSRIFRSNPAAMVITNFEDRTIVDMNDAAERLFGTTRAAARGLPTLVGHEDAAACEAQHDRMDAAGAIRNVPTSLRAADGRRIEALVSSELIEQDGQRYGVNTLIDVTESAAAREALARSELRFERLFRGSAAATLIFTPDEGRIVECNDAYVALIRHPRERLVGRTGLELGIWHDPAQRLAARALQDREGRVRDFEADLVAGDGAVRHCVLSWDPIEFGGQTAIVAYVVDVTERREAERALRQLTASLEVRVAERTEQLEAAMRELEAFSYSVSHDLKAPLRAIDGFTRILGEQAGGRLGVEDRDIMRRVLDAAARMSRLIDDLLDLARVGRATMSPEAVDLSALANEVLETLRQRDPSREVEARVAPGIVAQGDASLLRVVLDNLIGNAWKFTGRRAGARIDFGLESMPDGRPVYVVRDNGAGFDLSHAAKLFAPFQRYHKFTEFEGTGIGLATVQRIVARHGGRIWAESSPGHGAAFRFTLGGRPAAQAGAAAASRS